MNSTETCRFQRQEVENKGLYVDRRNESFKIVLDSKIYVDKTGLLNIPMKS